MEREQYEHLSALGKEDLIRLIEIYSKNWLALDGVWFQSVERKRGMDEAMEHDAEAWRRFTVIEARRIKTFLGLPEHAGLEGLAAALRLRFYANLNTARIGREGDTLVYTMTECRVQTAVRGRGCPITPASRWGCSNTGCSRRRSTTVSAAAAQAAIQT